MLNYCKFLSFISVIAVINLVQAMDYAGVAEKKVEQKAVTSALETAYAPEKIISALHYSDQQNLLISASFTNEMILWKPVFNRSHLIVGYRAEKSLGTDGMAVASYIDAQGTFYVSNILGEILIFPSQEQNDGLNLPVLVNGTRVTSLCTDRAGRLFTGDEEGVITVWEKTDPSKSKTFVKKISFQAHQGKAHVTGVIVDSENTLFSIASDNSIRMWKYERALSGLSDVELIGSIKNTNNNKLWLDSKGRLIYYDHVTQSIIICQKIEGYYHPTCRIAVLNPKTPAIHVDSQDRIFCSQGKNILIFQRQIPEHLYFCQSRGG